MSDEEFVTVKGFGSDRTRVREMIEREALAYFGDTPYQSVGSLSVDVEYQTIEGRVLVWRGTQDFIAGESS